MVVGIFGPMSSNKKYNIDIIKEQFDREGYKLLSTKYINNRTKLNYVCPKGHTQKISWHDWLLNYRCPFCANNVKHDLEFIRKAFRKEGYELLSNEYINSKQKLSYICKNGHQGSIRWNDWQQGHRCQLCYWKDGITKEKLPSYDTYINQLNFAEEVRLFCDKMGRRLLEVKCSRCGKWFVPSIYSVNGRIGSLNGKKYGEHRFYCSQECKDSCEVFGKRAIDYIDLTSKQKESVYSSEELSIWSKEVLNRANFKCEICGDTATDAHHIEPKKLQPMLALDPDNGLALCKSCHYKYGHSGECSTGNLANIICN